MHRKRLGVPVAMGVGGSFEILVGDMRRAPRLMQRTGLEWFMRMVQEPSRLGPRYLRDFIGLSRRLPMALMAAWTQRPYLGQSTVTSVNTNEVMHVYVHGKLTGETLPALESATAFAVSSGLVMVMHLQAVRQANAVGLGYLMEARRELLEAGLSLSLAGLSLKLRFLLHAWCAQPLFDEWQPTVGVGMLLKTPGTEQASSVRLNGEPEALPVETHLQW
jgi:N-acetylglucosaminyldiphosphoundecaprenol N-acetyl-beta-D-mannosaminyltransferase